MQQEKIRKNNNLRYVWYLEQSTVDFIEEILIQNGLPVNVYNNEIHSGLCRVKSLPKYEILCNSDNLLIRGIKDLETGKIYL